MLSASCIDTFRRAKVVKDDQSCLILKCPNPPLLGTVPENHLGRVRVFRDSAKVEHADWL